MNNTLIGRKDSLKFLGVLIDENLLWKSHIKLLESKLACAIGLLYKSRPFLDLNARKLLYFSFVHSHLSYANIVWGATHPSKLEKLAGLQRRACKIITFKKKRESAIPVMEDLKILSIEKLNRFQVLVFMYNFNNKQLPLNFTNFFKQNKSSIYSLRSNLKGNFFLPKNSCKYVEHSLSYRGPKLWNSLYNEIKIPTSLHTFKRLLKYYLVFN